MNWELLVQVIGHLAWPAVAIIAVLLFRRQITEMLHRTREFEGPGTKIKLDPAQVEKMAEAVSQGKVTPEDAAVRLEQSALDPRAYRILRALLDEDEGRALNGYQNFYYRNAFASVIDKGWVRKEDKRYYLTDKGKTELRSYLRRFLQ